jgi:hypothetical protein
MTHTHNADNAKRITWRHPTYTQLTSADEVVPNAEQEGTDERKTDLICTPQSADCERSATGQIGGYRVSQIQALTTFRDRCLMSPGICY